MISFKHPVNGATTAFTPALRLAVLNLGDDTVQEGLRLSLDRLDRMEETCRAAGVHLLVALIPTKERVYASCMMARNDHPEIGTFRRLIENEREVLRQVERRLDEDGVRYVDLATALSEAAALGAVYPANDDGHPNAEGYSVIARAVAQSITDWLPAR
jgi:hypothetical protein